MSHSIALIVGTRPEGIKMMPVYFALKKAGLPVTLIATGQHRELLAEVFDAFDVKPDIDLALGKPGQDLSDITQTVLNSCKELFSHLNPRLVLVQGDTTTVMAAALQAFYQRIPIGHVEAGLRTGDMYQPYPEEMNRRVVGMIADYHFVPTPLPGAHLLAEGVDRSKIFYTGNTVVDALHFMQDRLSSNQNLVTPALQQLVKQHQAAGKKIILFTMHRRESFDGGIAQVLRTLQQLVKKHADCAVIYPAHPNPSVMKAIEETGIRTTAAINVMNPVSYTDLVYLLLQADLVMTDSGGIQEEAVSLGKPTLILRDKTERAEGIWEGIARLVGTDPATIITAVEHYLQRTTKNAPTSVYGDGYAGERIVTIIKNELVKLDLSSLPVEKKLMNQRLEQ